MTRIASGKTNRRTLLQTLAVAPIASATALHLGPLGIGIASAQEDKVRFGVSAPLTGNNAEYGRIWQQGMGLALEEINATGGLAGRTLELQWEDTQADPKQSVPVAQKFVGDSAIIAELGDFASPASMAASPIYERGKMVQFGLTNSHPDFTKGGEFMFSPSLSQLQEASNLAQIAFDLYGSRQAVLYRNTDWGKVAQEIYTGKLAELGGEALVVDSYLDTEKDFRPLLAKISGAAPNVLTLISYYTDGALLAQQAQAVGLQAKIVAIGSCYSPKFIELGGDAVNGVVTTTAFFPGDALPEAQPFIDAYRAKYDEEPDGFAAGAYDALKIIAWAAEQGNFTREGVQQALLNGTEIPSIINGPFQFGPDRRIAEARLTTIEVADGQFVAYQPA